ncbi:hypothetical protein Ancab_001648 [Ancistrocladus abbreviatus]
MDIPRQPEQQKVPNDRPKTNLETTSAAGPMTSQLNHNSKTQGSKGPNRGEPEGPLQRKMPTRQSLPRLQGSPILQHTVAKFHLDPTQARGSQRTLASLHSPCRQDTDPTNRPSSPASASKGPTENKQPTTASSERAKSREPSYKNQQHPEHKTNLLQGRPRQEPHKDRAITEAQRHQCH